MNRLLRVVAVAAVLIVPVVAWAQDQTSKAAAFIRFEEEVRGHLMEVRKRHDALEVGAGGRSPGELREMERLVNEADSEAARKVAAITIPPELGEGEGTLAALVRSSAAGAIEARSRGKYDLSVEKLNVYMRTVWSANAAYGVRSTR